VRVELARQAQPVKNDRNDGLGSLFRDVGRDLTDFVSRRVGPQDAADLVQDSFLRLLERDAVALMREPRAYLFGIAANLVTDRWRALQRRNRVEIEDQDAAAIADPRPDPASCCALGREAAALLAALEELPPACRDAFVLNRLEGLGHAEIARRMGVSSKTVQRHIARALEHCMLRRMQDR
jgi:RNA polymerase sigma factor (sigma-70 family)